MPYDDRGAPCLIAALHWAGGSRHLHIPVLKGNFNLAFLLSQPTPEPPSATELLAPTRSFQKKQPHRGLGVEIELITMEPNQHGEQHGDDPSISATKSEELQAFIAAVERAAEHAAAPAPIDDHLSMLLRYSAAWQFVVDTHIYPTSDGLASRIIEQEQQLKMQQGRELKQESGCELRLSECRENRARRMLCHGAGTLKSEFRSPLPPNELNFSQEAVVLQSNGVAGMPLSLPRLLLSTALCISERVRLLFKKVHLPPQ